MHAVTAKDRLRQQLHRMSSGTLEPVNRDRVRCASPGLPVDALRVPTCPEPHKSVGDKFSMFAPTCFATHGTLGVLDLGASKTVVGADSVAALTEGLDPSLRDRLTRCPCDITFKFGNQGTLRSSQALVVPLGRLLLKVAIVSGNTPFLMSNSLMRVLQAEIDCSKHQFNWMSPLTCT